MNYFLSIIYLLFIFTFSYVTGKTILVKLGFSSVYLTRNIISGFLYLTLIQWVCGFSAQLFHLSWNIYYISLLVIYLVHIIFLIKMGCITFSLNKDIITNHIKNFWFLYLLVAMFTLMSITSQFPYLELNYDDAYYLGAIQQEIGVESLGRIDYFSGLPQDLDLARLLNTFHLQYAFWSVCFHIEPVAFARFAAVIQNYLLIFFIYHMFLTGIKGDEKNIQYSLALFSILLIPAGYLKTHGIISAYDDWQMNTAIWYGSSLVRLGALPVLLYFGKLCCDKLTIKSCIWCMILCVSFFSYSTIVFPIIIFVGVLFSFYKMWKFLLEQNIHKSHIVFISILILFLCMIIVVPQLLYDRVPELKDAMDSGLEGYRGYANVYLQDSIIMKFMTPALILLAFWKGNKKLKEATLIIILILTVLFIGIFDKFIILCSMNYNFVALRFTTSAQMMLLLLFSYSLFHIITKKYIQVGTSLFLVIIVNVFNYTHLADYRNLHSVPATALSKYGYSPKRVIKNPHMMPEVCFKIGDIFNDFDEKQLIIAPTFLFDEDAVLKLSESLAFASAKISVLSNIGDLDKINDPVINEERTKIYNFINGYENVEHIDSLLKKYNVDFIITEDVSLVNIYEWNIYITIPIDESRNLYVLELHK